MQRVKPTRKLSQPVAILILVAVLAIIGLVVWLVSALVREKPSTSPRISLVQS